MLLSDVPVSLGSVNFYKPVMFYIAACLARHMMYGSTPVRRLLKCDKIVITVIILVIIFLGY